MDNRQLKRKAGTAKCDGERQEAEKVGEEGGMQGERDIERGKRGEGDAETEPHGWEREKVKGGKERKTKWSQTRKNKVVEQREPLLWGAGWA